MAPTNSWSEILVRFVPKGSRLPLYGVPSQTVLANAHALAAAANVGFVGATMRVVEGDPFDPAAHTVTDREAIVDQLLAPTIAPSVLCIGLNYRAHAAEFKAEVTSKPVVFMKPPTALTPHLSNIVLPQIAAAGADYEAEVAVVIGAHRETGRHCKNVSRADAHFYIAGYTIANDISSRILQRSAPGGQWCFSKSFDTFLPLGPFLAHPNLVDAKNLRIVTKLNGQVMQDGNSKAMIADVPGLIEYLSQGTTLAPGTVICTGTPEGVGGMRDPPVVLKHGDVIEVAIDGLGVLRNHVVNEVPSSNL
ncbi:5-carboxymethyl-2-hydroxymuconate delta-isomerase [Cladochytrium replicatum]|nr:5-carboxymethyl-2-hydroxymuconate delta-isomerase [Cladochytrium replicatum]